MTRSGRVPGSATPRPRLQIANVHYISDDGFGPMPGDPDAFPEGVVNVSTL